ncbi:MAG: hypothetical protein DCF25_09630, partial [Leptolyngbya foveolarum]
LLHESPPAQAARRVVRNQFKFFRAALITGTAAIALVFGGLTQLVAAGKLMPIARLPEPAEAPWYADANDIFTADFPSTQSLSVADTPERAPDSAEITAVSFRPASRFPGRTVEAALETVAVVPHDDVVAAADPTVTLMFGGELGLNNFLFEDASSIDTLFSEIDLYQQADVSMVGLAEPLANASTSLQEDFYQRTRPQAVEMLKAGGIDIVSLASEGTMIYGTRGLDETLNTLDRQGIYRVGAGRNEQEAHRPEILEVKGQRIAYLGYNPDALKGAGTEKAGVALANSKERQHIIEDIRAIRTQVDWIVVNFRWGEALDELAKSAASSAETFEQSGKPNITTSQPADWQRSLAHEAVDAGADLVVGYYPNHIQGAEIYRDRAIAYSLGDFVFDQSPLQDHDTAALRVSLRNQHMKVEFLPITIRESKLQMATGDRGAAILQTIRDASKNFEQPMRFPTVLKAKPNFKLPDSLKAQPSDLDYPSAPNPSPNLDPETSAPEPGIEPAPHPTVRESEALFAPESAPEPDIKTHDIELDQWGEKPATSGREFEPIPEGAVQRQQDSEPDVGKPDVGEPDGNLVESEVIESESDTSAEPTDFDRSNEVDYQPAETPSTNSIEPYAEPLVGPISAVPVDALAEPLLGSIAPIETAEITPSAPPQIEAPVEVLPEIESSPPRPKVFDD